MLYEETAQINVKLELYFNSQQARNIFPITDTFHCEDPCYMMHWIMVKDSNILNGITLW